MSFLNINYITQCYNDLMVEEYHIGDIVRLRKAHPCGGFEWEIVRLGADIGLVCKKCNHRVLLTRRELARRIKEKISCKTDLNNPSL